MDRCSYTGKRIYVSLHDAKEALKGLKRKHTYRSGQRVNRKMSKRRERRVYFCEFCKGYHLTSWDHFSPEYKLKKKRHVKKNQGMVPQAEELPD